jgi:putative proteasome-type protease
MTYCVGMRTVHGLVFLSDSRTNAGVDQISTFRKMTVFEKTQDRVLVLMTAGNLAISQAVRQQLSQHDSTRGQTLWTAPNMYEAVACVGDAVRSVYARDAESLKKFGHDFNVSLLFGGQIQGSEPTLFMVYAAGNYIETTPENPYFQIGEAKYGKPIIDRVLTATTPLDQAAKCALISMDSTLRSNISVGLPLDLLIYERDRLEVTRFAHIDQRNKYFEMIHSTWGERLKQVFYEIPDPTWEQTATFATGAEMSAQGNTLMPEKVMPLSTEASSVPSLIQTLAPPPIALNSSGQQTYCATQPPSML